MRSALLLAFSLGFVVTACSETGATPEPASSTAAESVNPSLLCLYPSTHPFNGISQVFTMTAPSSDGAMPEGAAVSRQSGFYWHGLLISLDRATDRWPIGNADATGNGGAIHFAARGDFSIATLDLTAPDGQFGDRSGTLDIKPLKSERGDEIVPIVEVRDCPTASTP
jgi:hypothetical protein